LAALGLTLVPHVSSQPENIKVLSYSYYFDSIPFLDVVGEVQNMGPNTIDTVVLSGTIYTTDGEAVAFSLPTTVLVKYLLPQQKAPFYMEFPPEVSITKDYSWISVGIDHVEFTVNNAKATSSYQYPDLTVTSSSGAANAQGEYWVTGTVQNTGTQTATNVLIVATFYNASGTVVATGYTDQLTPTSLTPSSTTSFRVGAFDLNQTEVPSSLKIFSYTLLIQTEGPILTGTAPVSTPTPTSPPSTTPPSDSTPTPTGSPGSGDNGLAPEIIYAIVVVIVILGLVGTWLLARKKKPQTKAQMKKKRKLQKRKKQE
jgi:hypothetical protein